MRAHLAVGLFVVVGGVLGACSSGTSAADLSLAPDLAVDDLALADLTPTVTSITLQATNPKILVDDQLAFVATATYSDASQKDVTTRVTWSSSSNATATIAASGIAKGVDAGSTMIVAKLGEISSPGFALAVRSVASIALSWQGGGSGPTTPRNTPIQITATATLSDTETLDITAHPRTVWTRDDSSIVVSINAGVAMPGDNAGTSPVHASLGGKTATVTVFVTP